jgi:hypothetical protein
MDKAHGKGINILKSVWPGAVTSIKPHGAGPKVCANVSWQDPPSRPDTRDRRFRVFDRVWYQAVVNDMQFRYQPVALLAKLPVLRYALAAGLLVLSIPWGLAALWAMFSTVCNCSRSPRRLGELRCRQSAHHFPGRLGILPDQGAHTFAHYVDVDVAHQMRAPMRCQQSIHQCLQAISLPNSDRCTP